MAKQNESHHSRVSTLMIDCLADRFDESVGFWCRALGLPEPEHPPEDGRYLRLGQIEGPLFVQLQKVDAGAGYHLDFESDGIDAEADRLEAAGARRKYFIKRWWVLEDPSGNAFCVIRPESEGFPQNAKRWEDKA